MADLIKVQQQDFDVTELYESLCQSDQTGAVTMFIGRVRDFVSSDKLDHVTTQKIAIDTESQSDSAFELEHYPGMTEHNLQKIVNDANLRWDLHEVTVVHRVGKLRVQDQIVFVGVSSSHRAESLQACDFIMDYLKSRAAFWKKETQAGESEWVAAKDSDQESLNRWS